MRSPKWFRSVLVCALTVAVLAVQPSAAAAQPLPSLFADAARGPAAQVVGRAEIVRTRRLSVRTDLLAAALAPGANVRTPFVLNLFPDVVLTLVRERLEFDGRGHTSWVGAVDGDPASTATLTWNGRTLVGGVVTRGEAFDIDTNVDGSVSVSQRASTVVPVELAPRVPPPSGAAPSMSSSTALADASTATIDLLVLYTTAARTRAGGVSQIQAQLANAVAATNTAFQRSGINAVLTAVGVQELPYAESANLNGDLSAISLGGVQSAAVEAARTALGADLVTMVTGRASSSSGCGMAWIGPYSVSTYSVTEQACLYAGQWSLSHELGHNFGADHAPGDSAQLGEPYARGYRDGSIRTLMAYAIYGSPARILSYSSASVREPAGTGLPTGTSLQDNARRLGETVAMVAGYRATVGGPGLPPAPTGLSANVSGPTVTLAWQAVAGATSYLVQVGTAPGDSATLSSTVGVASLTGAIPPPGTYYWRARAQNSSGTGAASAESTFTIVPVSTGAPGAPTGVAAGASGSTVTVSWNPPATGGVVTSYELEAGPSPGSGAYGRLSVAPSPLAVVNVPNGTYYLRMRAVGPAGASPPSADAVVTVGATCTPPGISTLTSSVAGGVVSLAWTTPSGTGPFSYYLAVGSGAGASNYGVFPMGAANALSTTPPPGTYYVRVIAANACGVGAASSDIIATP